MKNMEKILSIINEVRKRSFWVNEIKKVSLQNFLSDCYKKDYNKDFNKDFVERNYYEIRFYVDEEKILSEFDVNADEIVEAVDHFLLPALRTHFIAKLQEVSYLNDDVEIVIICESVELK